MSSSSTTASSVKKKKASPAAASSSATASSKSPSSPIPGYFAVRKGKGGLKDCIFVSWDRAKVFVGEDKDDDNSNNTKRGRSGKSPTRRSTRRTLKEVLVEAEEEKVEFSFFSKIEDAINYIHPGGKSYADLCNSTDGTKKSPNSKRKRQAVLGRSMKKLRIPTQAAAANDKEDDGEDTEVEDTEEGGKDNANSKEGSGDEDEDEGGKKDNNNQEEEDESKYADAVMEDAEEPAVPMPPLGGGPPPPAGAATAPLNVLLEQGFHQNQPKGWRSQSLGLYLTRRDQHREAALKQYLADLVELQNYREANSVPARLTSGTRHFSGASHPLSVYYLNWSWGVCNSYHRDIRRQQRNRPPLTNPASISTKAAIVDGVELPLFKAHSSQASAAGGRAKDDLSPLARTLEQAYVSKRERGWRAMALLGKASNNDGGDVKKDEKQEQETTSKHEAGGGGEGEAEKPQGEADATTTAKTGETEAKVMEVDSETTIIDVTAIESPAQEQDTVTGQIEGDVSNQEKLKASGNEGTAEPMIVDGEQPENSNQATAPVPNQEAKSGSTNQEVATEPGSVATGEPVAKPADADKDNDTKPADSSAEAKPESPANTDAMIEDSNAEAKADTKSEDSKVESKTDGSNDVAKPDSTVAAAEGKPDAAMGEGETAVKENTTVTDKGEKEASETTTEPNAASSEAQAVGESKGANADGTVTNDAGDTKAAGEEGPPNANAIDKQQQQEDAVKQEAKQEGKDGEGQAGISVKNVSEGQEKAGNVGSSDKNDDAEALYQKDLAELLAFRKAHPEELRRCPAIPDHPSGMKSPFTVRFLKWSWGKDISDDDKDEDVAKLGAGVPTQDQQGAKADAVASGQQGQMPRFGDSNVEELDEDTPALIELLRASWFANKDKGWRASELGFPQGGNNRKYNSTSRKERERLYLIDLETLKSWWKTYPSSQHYVFTVPDENNNIEQQQQNEGINRSKFPYGRSGKNNLCKYDRRHKSGINAPWSLTYLNWSWGVSNSYNRDLTRKEKRKAKQEAQQALYI